MLLVVAALVIGPERLPGYAEQLGSVVRKGREFMQEAKARVDEELGDEAATSTGRRSTPAGTTRAASCARRCSRTTRSGP